MNATDSKLWAFLHPARPVNEEKEVVISDRFKNQDGTTMAFTIRAIPQDENDANRSLSTRKVKENGQWTDKFDAEEFSRRTIVAGTVFPDFRSEEVCKSAGVADPLLAPAKLLKSGEYARLSAAILELSAFDDSPEGEARIEEEIKN